MSFRVFSNLVHLHCSRSWSPARIQRSQLSLLRRLVSIAQREVPLYRDKYSTEGIAAETITDLESFHRLPIVTKADLKANFPDRIVSDRVQTRSLHSIATSGTTDRVMLFQDQRKRNWDRAADLFLAIQGDRFRPGHRSALIPADACYERCGADEHGRVESVGTKLAQLVRSGRGHRKEAARQLRSQIVRDYFWRLKILKSLGVDGTAVDTGVLDEHIRTLRAWRPRVLSGLPMFLYVLAKHRNNGDTRPLVPVVRPAGSKLTDLMIQTVEEGFGARVRENYGTAELGTISFDCASNRQQHLLSELFYIEIVRRGRQVAPGEPGELIITDLRNHVAPLIRYAVGDVGRYYDGPCQCGHKGLLFSVDGLVEETIVTPQGRAVTGDRVVDFFLALPEIDHAKIIQQSPDRFLVEIVPDDPAVGVPSSEWLSESFSAFLGYSVTVRARPVRRLAPERSGKYKLVSSCSYQRLHDPGSTVKQMAPG